MFYLSAKEEDKDETSHVVGRVELKEVEMEIPPGE